MAIYQRILTQIKTFLALSDWKRCKDFRVTQGYGKIRIKNQIFPYKIGEKAVFGMQSGIIN